MPIQTEMVESPRKRVKDFMASIGRKRGRSSGHHSVSESPQMSRPRHRISLAMLQRVRDESGDKMSPAGQYHDAKNNCPSPGQNSNLNCTSQHREPACAGCDAILLDRVQTPSGECLEDSRAACSVTQSINTTQQRDSPESSVASEDNVSSQTVVKPDDSSADVPIVTSSIRITQKDSTQYPDDKIHGSPQAVGIGRGCDLSALLDIAEGDRTSQTADIANATDVEPPSVQASNNHIHNHNHECATTRNVDNTPIDFYKLLDDPASSCEEVEDSDHPKNAKCKKCITSTSSENPCEEGLREVSITDSEIHGSHGSSHSRQSHRDSSGDDWPVEHSGSEISITRGRRSQYFNRRPATRGTSWAPGTASAAAQYGLLEIHPGNSRSKMHLRGNSNFTYRHYSIDDPRSTTFTLISPSLESYAADPYAFDPDNEITPKPSSWEIFRASKSLSDQNRRVIPAASETSSLTGRISTSTPVLGSDTEGTTGGIQLQVGEVSRRTSPESLEVAAAFSSSLLPLVEKDSGSSCLSSFNGKEIPEAFDSNTHQGCGYLSPRASAMHLSLTPPSLLDMTPGSSSPESNDSKDRATPISQGELAAQSLTSSHSANSSGLNIPDELYNPELEDSTLDDKEEDYKNYPIRTFPLSVTSKSSSLPHLQQQRDQIVEEARGTSEKRAIYHSAADEFATQQSQPGLVGSHLNGASSRDPLVTARTLGNQVATGDFDLVCIGFGPGALAIAIAIADTYSKWPGTPLPKVLFLEKQDKFAWHSGMQLPSAKMQISFLKDLATPRDPTSPFSFLNYLHVKGRFQQFANLGTLLPSRAEYEDYMAWCASQFSNVVKYGSKVYDIVPTAEGKLVNAFSVYWTSSNSDSEMITARHVVIAAGGSPSIPEVLQPFAKSASLPTPQGLQQQKGYPNKVTHSSYYASTVKAFQSQEWHSNLHFAVIGAGQSAAEIFDDLCDRFPHAKVSLVIKGSSLRPSDDSPFVNEIFDPDRVDSIFYRSDTERRAAIHQDKGTNYGVVRLELLERINERLYLQRVREADENKWRATIMFNQMIVAAHVDEADPESPLILRLGKTDVFGKLKGDEDYEDIKVTHAFTATGYSRNIHQKILEATKFLLPSKSAHDDYPVGRKYDIQYDAEKVDRQICGVWLQGCNESTHGLSDTLLSILAVRGGEMVSSILSDSNLDA